MGLPRGIPAASLKRHGTSDGIHTIAGLPRGIPAASLKPARRYRALVRRVGLPRGIPAASLKPDHFTAVPHSGKRLPRGIPAASLKQHVRRGGDQAGVGSSAGNTRGLIEAAYSSICRAFSTSSSAGNTRGLIEATQYAIGPLRFPSCLPRGIPAASLKLGPETHPLAERHRLPRGIPAASLKPTCGRIRPRSLEVFRGEYPRPH